MGLICLFFLLTRIYNLDKIPPSLYWDEASIAYNAYSISRTGKDEWGEFLPIHFRAFGEFKLPIYIYTTAIFVKLIGLNEYAVRLPAILFSLLTIIITFFLAKELFKDSKIALLSAFFLSISPWWFIFTRVGYEASAGLMFFMLGVYLMLKALRKRFLVLFAVFAFIFSIYSYNSFRVLVPITLLLFLFLHAYSSKKSFLLFCGALIIFVISLAPIARLLIFDAGFGRVQSFVLLPTIQQVYDLSGKPRLQLIFDRSGPTDWSKNVWGIFNNYLVHFSPSFLLFDGDTNPRNHPAGSGQFFLPDPVLILLGIFIIKRKKKRLLYLPIMFVLLGPVPAVLFRESPHALRSLAIVPFLCMVMGAGASAISDYFKKSTILIIIVYSSFFAYFFHNFITRYPVQSSQDWQYGYRRLFIDYKDSFDNFDKVIISDEYAQPYIFALYNLKYNPEKFKEEVKHNDINNWGFSTVSAFGNFEFRKIAKNDFDLKKTLIFASSIDKSDTKDSQAQIKFLNGETAFWVYNLY